MNAEIRENKIVLSVIPDRDIYQGLAVEFLPSLEWERQNPSSLPFSRADIKSGQREYDIPLNISPDQIKVVFVDQQVYP